MSNSNPIPEPIHQHKLELIINPFNELVKSTPAHLLPLPMPKPAIELEEDEYIAGVSRIIQRDFFPDLEALRAKSALMMALEERDTFKASRAAADLAVLRNNEQMDGQMTLDQYQTKFTSEDNKSFQDLIYIENIKKQSIYKHFYKGEERCEQLKITSSEAVAGLFLTYLGIALPINTWTYSAKSALMYGPQDAPMVVGDLPITRGAPKEISYRDTRLKDSFFANEEQGELDKMHTERVWRDVANATPGLLRGDQTPIIRGFKMVPSTPDLRPNIDLDPSELVTWGMVDSTPLLMSGSTPGFKMASTPRREIIGNKLSDKATKSLKARSGFKKPGERMRSPALVALAKRLGRSESALKASYTPTGRTPGLRTPGGRTTGRSTTEWTPAGETPLNTPKQA